MQILNLELNSKVKSLNGIFIREKKKKKKNLLSLALNKTHSLYFQFENLNPFVGNVRSKLVSTRLRK
jgi:plasmid maintenance system killer protein